ncbi:SDR family oxidoreductase [Methylophilus sp. UBA6697]|jgi:NAD(P)-dependent dehydrogenase (short-subunit alcohol dehydrogenase family)|uniref:SDR family oxidoreductase n=1 Tax=Methylophilus sp. UBA6697 TaxID=1946902 RepID=UPI000EBDEA73|nr:SDR family oxidoreductase [Methylophilus sp. UBA6697]HCU85602.1 short-chain dehydrogenase [Methylophilus sp.]
MSTSQQRIALITGGNRGIGFETAKKLGEQGIKVIIGARDPHKGEQAVAELKALGVDAEYVHYDATQANASQAVATALESRFGKLDILVNNAGILKEELIGQNNTLSVDQDTLKTTFEANFFAVVALTQALLPLLQRSPAARIVNLSSILGSQTLHSTPNSPIEVAKGLAYNASKSALNMFTIHLAHALKDSHIKVNSAHPGWVKTDLGGPNAPMEISDSWKTSVRLATLDEQGPTGGYFHEDQPLPW